MNSFVTGGRARWARADGIPQSRAAADGLTHSGAEEAPLLGGAGTSASENGCAASAVVPYGAKALFFLEKEGGIFHPLPCPWQRLTTFFFNPWWHTQLLFFSFYAF